ncbi:response regulator [candidate division KSB1 bacterium]|nr:response regulator [candidate division KSB1 bacterium]
MIKLLIVEDEFIIAFALKVRLEEYGFTVLPIAATASDAVQLAIHHNPDIILMDVMLKGSLTGVDAARQIYELKNIPIIFLTGNRHYIDGMQLKELQNCKILSKPPSELELIDEIKRCVEF